MENNIKTAQRYIATLFVVVGCLFVAQCAAADNNGLKEFCEAEIQAIGGQHNENR